MDIYTASTIYIPGMLIILLLSLFFYWRRKHRYDNRATETVTGQITDIDDEENYEGTARRHFWIITYKVNETEYTLRQQYMKLIAIGVQGKMKEHLYENVTVHYDPSAPKKAWAETPDRMDSKKE